MGVRTGAHCTDQPAAGEGSAVRGGALSLCSSLARGICPRASASAARVSHQQPCALSAAPTSAAVAEDLPDAAKHLLPPPRLHHPHHVVVPKAVGVGDASLQGQGQDRGTEGASAQRRAWHGRAWQGATHSCRSKLRSHCSRGSRQAPRPTKPSPRPHTPPINPTHCPIHLAQTPTRTCLSVTRVLPLSGSSKRRSTLE